MRNTRKLSTNISNSAGRAAAAAVAPHREYEVTKEEWDEAMLVRFVLRKEKQDTLGAVADLAEALGVPERAFSYAGLKDFHAVTVQEVVVQETFSDPVGRLRIEEYRLRDDFLNIMRYKAMEDQAYSMKD